MGIDASLLTCPQAKLTQPE